MLQKEKGWQVDICGSLCGWGGAGGVGDETGGIKADVTGGKESLVV